MEETRRDAGALTSSILAAGTESPSTEPPSSRRRAGALKRKSTSGLSNASSTSSKRFVREKAFASQTAIHNGPLTRARQGPSNLASAVDFATGASNLDQLGQPRDATGAATAAAVDEFNKACEEWEALEASIEAEFEAIRSRNTNAHVVPNHCGWFSWTKIHLLEERTLPSFFDGKSLTRTPEIYMEIRNWIVKKFHANPNTQIELKDLSGLEAGDFEARQEVLEFLDHWGLINFHPFLSKDCDAVNAAVDGEAKNDSVVEKLYRFQGLQSYPPIVPTTKITTQAAPSGLLPLSSNAEELVGPEDPEVEYHCNSCSADCSRKRYHCQKQADFDLCSDCFNNRKFDSGMASSDFILMEPAQALGLSGGNWTDQETLLLLEALELYKENWSEIAEHVATKTKSQCILHFVQMPIEDSFLDCDNDIDETSKGIADPASANDPPIPKDTPQAKESNAGTSEGESITTAIETSKAELLDEIKDGDENLKEDTNEVKVCEENLKSDDTCEEKGVQDTAENFALKALHEAFEAVGHHQMPEDPVSFSDTGNPVMALAVFLGQLGGIDVATATAHSSLKSISSHHSGMELAARHCFLLEDPPYDKNEPKGCESAPETADQDAKNNEFQRVKNKEEDIAASGLNGTLSSNDHIDKTTEDCIPEENSGSGVSEKKLLTAKEPDVTVTHKVAVPGNPSKPKTSDPLPSEKMDVSVPVQLTKVEKSSQTTEAQKDVLVKSNSKHPGKNDSQEPDTAEKSDSQEPVSQDSVVEKGSNQIIETKKDDRDTEMVKEDSTFRLKRAAVSALSAASVKAKLLANQEEDQIRQLATLLIEKQLHKLETKLGFFNEVESVMTRVREQMERSRQKLYHERAQIIAARLGIPASSSRAMPPPSTTNRIAGNFANSVPRPPMGMSSQRPPLSRPMGTMAPTLAYPSVPTTRAGSSVRPSNQDNLSSTRMK